MTRHVPQILCIGLDPILLECRCAVLVRGGYEAQAATVPEGYAALRKGAFELVIVSARLAAEQNGDFLAALPTETQTLILDGLTFPKDLLACVADRLQHGREGFGLDRR